MPARHFRKRPWYLCIAWDGSRLTVRCSFTEYVTTLSVWQMALDVRRSRRSHSSAFKTLPVGCSIRLYEREALLLHHLQANCYIITYCCFCLSCWQSYIRIFCTIMTRNAQNKPKMVTACLSICFNLDSDERLSVKFCIWSMCIHLITSIYQPTNTHIISHKTLLNTPTCFDLVRSSSGSFVPC